MRRQRFRLIVKRPEKIVTKVKKENVSAVASAHDGGTITIKGNK